MNEDAAPLGVGMITIRASDTHASFKTWRVHWIHTSQAFLRYQWSSQTFLWLINGFQKHKPYMPTHI